MKHKQLDVLFLGHDASRTGAPILLLRMLKWLREHTDLSFGVVLRAAGPLEAEFAAVAPTVVLDHRDSRMVSPAVRLLLRVPILRRLVRLSRPGFLKKNIRSWNPRLIYANTCATGHMIEFLNLPGVPVATHVHELEVVLRTIVGLEQFSVVKRLTNRYLAVSRAVQQNLITSHDIPADDIELISEFLPVAEYAVDDRDKARQHLQTEYGLPAGTLVIGASGSPGWRKGSDLFVHLAGQILRKRPDAPVCFVWVGGPFSQEEHEFLAYDCRQLGVDKHVRFIDTLADPTLLYRSFDLFTMISREDPYPLVTMEVAAMGVPVLCFDRAGGTQELVEDDAGFVVPYLDIAVMADRILELLDSPDLRRKLGDRIREKVAERNDSDVVMPKILETIRRMKS